VSPSISYHEEEQPCPLDCQRSLFAIRLQNISAWVELLSREHWEFSHPRISFKSVGEGPREEIVLLPLETYTYALEILLGGCYEEHVYGSAKFMSVTLHADVAIMGRSGVIDIRAQNW